MFRKSTAVMLLGSSFIASVAAAEVPSPPAPTDPDSRIKLDAKVHLGLAALRDAAGAARAGQPLVEPAETLGEKPALRIVEDRVVVDAIASEDSKYLLVELEALGMKYAQASGRVVSGQIPISAIDAAAELKSLKFMRPAYAITRAGNVTSQGDPAMRSDVARTVFGVDGTGVRVGVLSDSFNCLGGAAAGVGSGDLPAGIVVLKDLSPCTGATDEGRAMMEIVHDVAPGSPQSFYTAFDGQADFANGIRALAASGAKVIVDDVFYFAEPFFQDGIIAQAADFVKSNGVSYFSSAGNEARESYEQPFRPGGVTTLGYGGTTHNFNPGAGTDIFQRFSMPPRGEAWVVLQWDSPYFSVSGGAGSPNDVDIYVTNDPPTTALFGSADSNLGNDPIEFLNIVCLSTTTNCFGSLLITKYAGPDPTKLKYIYYGDFTPLEYDTRSSTIVGHSNALGAVSVGAASYRNTPVFGVAPPLLEFFSSSGTTPILFGLDGIRKSAPEFRPKPWIVGPDGADTTFFGRPDTDATGFPNFFGTSASAPHAAGVAALMSQGRPSLTPASIASILGSTALNMGPAGFDEDTGFGLVQANLAVRDALLCDVSRDGKVDRTDIALITAARNTTSSGILDLRDWNHDGTITVQDARGCVLACTNPGCAL